jgi:hypothetical protein
MRFKKKTTYEDIYKWRRSNIGTCFYCYEDKPVAIPLIGEKGICQNCLDHFRIGHVGTDRHLIRHFTRSLHTHNETITWLKDHGVKLAPNGQSSNCHYYMAINNLEIFDRYYDIISGNGDAASLSSEVIKKIKNSYTDIEIYNDGEIRIIY